MSTDTARECQGTLGKLGAAPTPGVNRTGVGSRARTCRRGGSDMRVLFIGGTGNISGAVSRMAVERGIELVLLNRGKHGTVPGARSLAADYADDQAVEAALGRDDVRRGRQLDRLHPRPGRAGRAALRVAHAAVRLHLLRLRLREAAPLAVHHGVDAPQEPLVAVLEEQDRLRGRARPRLARAGLPGDDRPAEPDLRHPPADRDRGLGLRDAPRPPPAAAGRSSCTGTARACGR